MESFFKNHESEPINCLNAMTDGMNKPLKKQDQLVAYWQKLLRHVTSNGEEGSPYKIFEI